MDWSELGRISELLLKTVDWLTMADSTRLSIVACLHNRQL